ncbi:hypothetical protein [Bacteroides sp.]
MGNFSQFFYFYPVVSRIIAGVIASLLIVILLLWLKIDSQQDEIYRLKVEKIDVESRLKALEMTLDMKKYKSRFPFDCE